MDKFLADESLDFRLIKFLRANGYQVQAIIEANGGINDEEVLSMANNSKAILITEDKDFGELTFRFKKSQTGIILIRLAGVGIGNKQEILGNFLMKHLNELYGKFTVITSDKIRIKNI